MGCAGHSALIDSANCVPVMRARLEVGARIIALHMTLAAPIQQLEAASSEIRSLTMPL